MRKETHTHTHTHTHIQDVTYIAKKSTGGTGSSNMLFTLRKPGSVSVLF